MGFLVVACGLIYLAHVRGQIAGFCDVSNQLYFTIKEGEFAIPAERLSEP
jgi:hypothetical protein